MLTLGIESSCDETAAAVVKDGWEALSSVVHSQIAAHQPYRGVVPEIASRAHVEVIGTIIGEAMRSADVDWVDLDHIAVTAGPGLASSLLIGYTAARALAARCQRPLIPVHHLAGHLYSIFLDRAWPREVMTQPMVVLLVTGGHTMLVRVDGGVQYRVLGSTLDDAAGEALDKGATLMGLSYPGGPEIEKLARDGDPARYAFPRALVGGSDKSTGPYRRALSFSFSGLKTSLSLHARNAPETMAPEYLPDVAASYQEAVFDALIDRLERAAREENVQDIACVGGVARNQRLRDKLDELVARLGVRLWLAPPDYCTDNAAMIAGAGHAWVTLGARIPGLDGIHPTWPLTVNQGDNHD
jgi:N6-L-threonylcarbamoyladenine synthase